MTAPDIWRRVAVGTALAFAAASAGEEGLAAQGMTGGLVIPTARVLPDHALAAGYGNYAEPAFTSKHYRRDILFGIGYFDFAELFGRVADYNNSPSGTYLNSGPRDVSANLKLRLPGIPESWPQIAAGWNDLGGGNVLFRSQYAVVSYDWRFLSGSVGYLKRASNQYEPGHSGAFGGVAWQIAPLHLSLLAEYDGLNAHGGGRWRSPPLAFLGDLQVVTTLQRSFGATDPADGNADAVSYQVGLFWPLGHLEDHRQTFKPRSARKPAAVDTAPPTAASPTLPEQRAALLRKLEAAGLERLRVGTTGDSGNTTVVVEYENHRYAWNELDAIGLVLGHATRCVPDARSIRAVTLADGLRVHETEVPASAYRRFLDSGAATEARATLVWRRGSRQDSAQTVWENETPSGTTRFRFEVAPDLNQTVGTEFGLYDYSLAAKPALVVPLWKGARATSVVTLPLAHSENMEDGRAFSNQRHRKGLETASLGQSLVLGSRMQLTAAAGRFHFDRWGAQGELQAFVPGSADLVRLRGALYDADPGGLEGKARVGAVSYRRFWGADQWTELGWQLFGNGTAGPTFEWTRWSGDVGVTLFGRQGGDTRFAGVRVSVPLTLRQGMKPRLATLGGPSRYSQSLRTMVHTEVNYIHPASARDLETVTSLDDALGNHGRLGEAALRSGIFRMREAFLRYSGDD